MRTASSYDYLFSHGTGLWQTDGRTDGQHYLNLSRAEGDKIPSWYSPYIFDALIDWPLSAYMRSKERVDQRSWPNRRRNSNSRRVCTVDIHLSSVLMTVAPWRHRTWPVTSPRPHTATWRRSSCAPKKLWRILTKEWFLVILYWFSLLHTPSFCHWMRPVLPRPIETAYEYCFW